MEDDVITIFQPLHAVPPGYDYIPFRLFYPPHDRKILSPPLTRPPLHYHFQVSHLPNQVWVRCAFQFAMHPPTLLQKEYSPPLATITPPRFWDSHKTPPPPQAAGALTSVDTGLFCLPWQGHLDAQLIVFKHMFFLREGCWRPFFLGVLDKCMSRTLLCLTCGPSSS